MVVEEEAGANFEVVPPKSARVKQIASKLNSSAIDAPNILGGQR